ncbi:MAG TPA: ElyC/SanA/YdcF family protein [Steroidobacteraceae bacterium]|nr:ElyC/SanA/YdcF family protein [Steroidobacteraceae bacterium]
MGAVMAVAGAVLRLVRRRRAASSIWLAAACVVYLSATAPVANALLMPLENRYPPIEETRNLPSVKYIVVLGSGYAPRNWLPVTAALDCDGLARIAEGVILMRRIPGAHLIVSGGPSGTGVPSALGYAKFAREMGVEPQMISSLDKSLDTAEEARSVAAAVGDSSFILVTSAYHMPRAMRLMRLAGEMPIPAPTGQLAPRHLRFGWRAWLATTRSLRKTERAIHEYLALAVIR